MGPGVKVDPIMLVHPLARFALGGIAVALAASLMPSASQAQSATLRFAHWLPPTHPLHRTGFVPWQEAVEKASGKSLNVRFFPAQQLGAAGDHYDMARDGVADIGFLNPGYQAGRFPIIAAGELPFLVANAGGGSRAIHEWYLKYAGREMGDVKVCHVFLHAPASIHSKRPIKVPEDVRGLKVRPAHSTMAQMVTMLGGSSVQVSAPESREAIERGVADAITFPWGSLIRPWGIDKAVTNHLDLALYVTTFVNAINKTSYEKLSPSTRRSWTPTARRNGRSGWRRAGRPRKARATRN
jgi:TRAP-type transport system periplasmic protein